MTDQSSLTDNYDGPWKEALETYFQECLAFLFPDVYPEINWSQNYEFLDKELQQIAPEGKFGLRITDKLVKVWLQSGEEAWILIHIEVQSQVDTYFAERMYVYNYRIYDRFARRVVSLAILGDETAGWRPSQFGYTLCGCEVRLTFPIVKLLDYNSNWDYLESHASPFAVVVRAHLHTQATRRRYDSRLDSKWRLTRHLYERGYHREDILRLFRFIDWLMALPPELTQQFEQTLHTYEEEHQMTYMTTFEKRGLEQGQQRKAREDIILVLEARFGSISEALIEQINGLEEIAVLDDLLKSAATAETVPDFEKTLKSM